MSRRLLQTCCLAVGLVAMAAGLAPAALISEVVMTPVPTPAGTFGPYIEIYLDGQSEPFDVAILRNQTIAQVKQVIHVDAPPPPHTTIAVIHEGDWPVAPVFGAMMIRVDDLDLGDRPIGHVAMDHRWIVLFDSPSELEPCESRHTYESVFDAAADDWAISTGGWPVDAMPGTDRFALPDGGGVTRLVSHTEAAYVEAFSFGSIDSDLSLPDGRRLNPGQPNLATLPEPGTLLLAAMCSIGLINRRVQRG